MTTKEIGDELENEILDRLRQNGFEEAEKTSTNFPGIDLVFRQAIAVQSKNSVSIGPEPISHFADQAVSYPLRIFVAKSFTPMARGRAIERGIVLFTVEDFRERFPRATEERITRRFYQPQPIEFERAPERPEPTFSGPHEIETADAPSRNLQEIPNRGGIQLSPRIFRS